MMHRTILVEFLRTHRLKSKKMHQTFQCFHFLSQKNNISENVYAIGEKERKETKRKATSEHSSAPKRRRGNEFIDDEAECDEDEESDMDEDGNLPDLIDDDVSDDDLSIKR